MSVRAQKNPAINSAASIEFLFGLTGVVSFRRALPTANYCTRELRWELDCFARWAQRMFKAARPPSDDCRRGRRATGPSSHAPAPPIHVTRRLHSPRVIGWRRGWKTPCCTFVYLPSQAWLQGLARLPSQAGLQGLARSRPLQAEHAAKGEGQIAESPVDEVPPRS